MVRPHWAFPEESYFKSSALYPLNVPVAVTPLPKSSVAGPQRSPAAYTLPEASTAAEVKEDEVVGERSVLAHDAPAVEPSALVAAATHAFLTHRAPAPTRPTHSASLEHKK